jgi:hypothetical protein
MAFNRNPMNCLSNIQHRWPRDGILRVEIVSNATADYSLKGSYAKEYSKDQPSLFKMHGIDANADLDLTKVEISSYYGDDGGGQCVHFSQRDKFFQVIEKYLRNKTSNYCVHVSE